MVMDRYDRIDRYRFVIIILLILLLYTSIIEIQEFRKSKFKNFDYRKTENLEVEIQEVWKR